MPSSGAQLRIKQLDQWFQARNHHYTKAEMLNKLEIGHRQFFKDISFMREHYNAPICEPQRSEGYVYYYEEKNFSIYNQMTEENIELIRSAIGSLQSFGGLPSVDLLNEVSKDLLPGKDFSLPAEQFVFYEENLNADINKWFSRIYTAIQYKECLKVKYKPFDADEPSAYIIHPYILKQYNLRWFAFCKCDEVPYSPMNLSLDRIVAITKSKNKYIENIVFNFSDYFDDFLGVTRPNDGKKVKIVLHFYGKTGKYIESRPLHPLQHHSWINDSTILEVRLDLMINYELEKTILSYADSVKVIQPASLAEKIRVRHSQASS